MATTVLTVRSERYGTTILSNNTGVAETSSADISENFALPPGFGDCVLKKVDVYLQTIQTGVANPETRAPTIFLVLNDIRDFLVQIAPWRRYKAAAMIAGSEALRPVAWYQNELLNVQHTAEDTGVGNTTTLSVVVAVERLRNIG